MTHDCLPHQVREFERRTRMHSDKLDEVVDGLGGTLDPLLDGTPLADTPLLGGLFSDSDAPVGSTAPRGAPQTLADLLTGGAR